MLNSIHHLYADIVESKKNLTKDVKLVDFPFERSSFEYFHPNGFPNIILKQNVSDDLFQGGEVLSIVERKKYHPLKLNPPIPSSYVNPKILNIKNSSLNFLRSSKRSLFYLLRGKNSANGKNKVCLISGAFFETVPAREVLVRTLFPDRHISFTQGEMDLLEKLFTKPLSFHPNSGLKVDLKMSVDVVPQGNILNPAKYPEIGDNTLNFVVPIDTKEDDRLHRKRMETAFHERKAWSLFSQLEVFTIKHHFNGPFLVFQTSL